MQLSGQDLHKIITSLLYIHKLNSLHLVIIFIVLFYLVFVACGIMYSSI